MMAVRRRTAAGLRHGVLLVLVVLTLYPVFLMVITSFKDNPEFYTNFLWIVLPLHLSNYGLAWQEVSPYILNSIVVTGGTVIAVVAFSALAAYAFARLRFVGKEFLYYLVIALLMIPYVLTLVPTFILVKSFGLLDSWWALILPYISGGVVFAIFVLRSFFSSLPQELFEAAYIDGASELQVFWRLGVPLIRPALGTVAILQILGTWNDYVWPSVVLFTDRLFTMPLGLVAFQGRHTTDWGPLMAGYTLASVPLVLLFAFATRAFIQGLTQGGLKL
jgi:multiple sugar transport system permease protein/raffinose/stachyose/melibiose transport system permease protein